MIRDNHNLMVFYIANNRRFSLSDAVDATGIERLKAIRILRKFVREGYIQEIKDERVPLRLNEYGPARRNPYYKRIQDISLRSKEKPMCQRDKIWRTIRFLRKFTRSDLIRLTGCDKTVEDYTRLLSLHGHIKCIGKLSNEKVWILLNDTGPKRPHIPEKKKNEKC